MNDTDLLIDIITLMIFEERLVVKHPSDTLIVKLLDILEKDERRPEIDSLVNTLITYIKDLLRKKQDGVKLTAVSAIRFIITAFNQHSGDGHTIDSEMFQTIIEKSIDINRKREEIKEDIQRLKKSLYNFYIKKQLKSISVAINRSRKRDMSLLLGEIRNKIEELERSNVVKDSAIITELLFNKRELEEDVEEVFNRVVDGKKLLCGYRAINDALGGLESGSTVVVGSRSNNNKSGFLIGLGVGVGLLNRHEIKEGKKPLLLHLSLEDSENVVIPRYYEAIRLAKGLEVESDKSLKEMSLYIEEVFRENGVTFMFTYVDPSQWSFRNLFNYVESIEASGYYLPAIVIDYLDKLPSTGLSTSGPIGSDRRELLRRSRNFFAKKQCTLITAWQLNPKLNEMLTNGLDPLEIPRFVAGKSFYQGSTSIINEIDLEIIVSIGKYGDYHYQAVSIGKVKGNNLVSEDKKNLFYQFPPNYNIPLDAFGDRALYKNKLEDFKSESSERELF